MLQGRVSNPRVPSSSLSYPNEAALQSRFEEVVHLLVAPSTAARVAAEIREFFNHTYYYMYDIYPFEYEGRTGVAG